VELKVTDRIAMYAADVEAPRAFLLTVVTRLCLNELDSARARRRRRDARRAGAALLPGAEHRTLALPETHVPKIGRRRAR
jgi:DNA-directed RNA polymerase specialized sigma24 family protein